MAPRQAKLPGIQGQKYKLSAAKNEGGDFFIPPLDPLAGVDEAGRGCLAGPVVAAAVILPKSYELPGLADSKKLPAKTRERLAALIRKQALAWSIGAIWPKRIDEINILNSSLEAMLNAVLTLSIEPRSLAIDGNFIIPQMWWEKKNRHNTPAQKAIIHGDDKIAAISAASIIAKVWRDKLMMCLARKYPQYGFEKHKGYGTSEHRAALKEFGPCKLHRLTFDGVK